jgi:serine/threonine protein kinase
MNLTGLKLGDRYVIERKLACGGFGAVYLAIDKHLNSRRVVVKTLIDAGLGTSFDDPWFRQRVQREIDALVMIQHPGVVGVFDCGNLPDGNPFLVMEYVEGENMRGVIQAGGIDLPRAGRIIRALGYALSAAHKAGVIHRDLKPENVMLQELDTGEEIVKLIDFGIATFKDFQKKSSLSTTRVAGTLPYMAPEQLRSHPVPASDIWALGVMAYEACTGQLPFNARNDIELEELQRKGLNLMPRVLRPEITIKAEEVILRALEFDAGGRYQVAHEMGEDFMRATLDGQAADPPATTEILGTKPQGSSPNSSDRPSWLRSYSFPFPPMPAELRRRCRDIFELCDEFRDPYSLRSFFAVEELRPFHHCVKHSNRLEFDELISCLQRFGRERPALIHVLALLATEHAAENTSALCFQLIDDYHRFLSGSAG